MNGYARVVAVACALAITLAPAAAYGAGTGDDPRPTKDRPTKETAAAERDYRTWADAKNSPSGEVVIMGSDIPYKYFWTPTHLQERSYWCGPGSIQILDDYWGEPASQATIAKWLGTTGDGTDFSLVDDALRYFTGRPYVYVGPIPSPGEVLNRIEYGLYVRRNPMVGDFYVPSTWPYYMYSHPGHIIVIEAFDWRDGTVRLNDCYEEAYWMAGGGSTSGHHVYDKWAIANALYAHWRRAVVY